MSREQSQHSQSAKFKIRLWKWYDAYCIFGFTKQQIEKKTKLSSPWLVLTIDGHLDHLAYARPDSVARLAHVVASIRVAGVENVERTVLVHLDMGARDDWFLFRWRSVNWSGWLISYLVI